MFLFLPAVPVGATEVEGRLAVMGQTTHFELRGQDQWTYEIEKKVEKKKTHFRVQVPALDPATVETLKGARAPGLDKILVHPGPDQSNVVEFIFNSNSVEHFDYLTDKPSRLVVDFFPRASSTPATAKAAKETAEETKAKSVAAKKPAGPVVQAGDRKPAADVIIIKDDEDGTSGLAKEPEKPILLRAGIFDGSDPDFSRFLIKDYEIKEEAIIASRQNVYVDFPILRLKPDEMRILEERMPAYNIEPKDTAENKQARLLLTLFNKGRLNVFLRSVEWFMEKYPKSQYAEIIDFMWADTYFKLWRQNGVSSDLDLAVVKYQEAMRKHPQSPLNERTALFIAYARLERGDQLGALQYFQSYLEKYPDSKNKDLVRIAMAEANYNLNRYKEAIGLYDEVLEKGLRPQEKVRAAFLKGDVYFKRKDDLQAIAEYRKVLTEHKKESDQYPSAYFNLASALFRTDRFLESLTAHVEFMKRFSSNSYSGFAMTRIGELLEILGADPARVIGAYLETHFRYGDTEGAIVARLRLLSARMQTMKEKELNRAVSEIMGLAGRSNLPKMDQFASVMIADGYHRRGDYEKSNDLLIKYYQGHPTTADTELLTHRIVRNFADQIHTLVEKKDFIQALKVHQDNSSSWLKNSSRIDIKYNLGRAFEQAGVFDEAIKMYRDSFNRILALRGTKAEKETGVFEKIPASDRILLRMAGANVARGDYVVAIDNLRGIERPESLSEVEQVERVVLASKLYEKKGEPETAVRYLTELVKTWRGVPGLVAEPYLQLGEMESRLGRKKEAIASFTRVDQLMQDSGSVSEATHLRALNQQADLQLELNQPEAAVATYQKLLDLYEKKRPLASLRYRLGKIHFDRGELKKAADVWKGFTGENVSFWRSLADDHLKSADWKEDYKKYLKRIPATSRNEGGIP